jgi:carbonic anhydrase
MKVIVFYLFFILFIKINNANNEKDFIDLFKFNQPQDFKIKDEEIDKQFKKLELKIKENKINKETLDNKGIDLIQIKNVFEKYAKIKNSTVKRHKFVSPNNKKTPFNFESIRFKEGNNNKIKNNLISKHVDDDEKYLKELTDEEKNLHEFNTRVRIFPYNIVLNKPDMITDKKNKNIFIDNRLLKKLISARQYAQNIGIKTIPIEECNKDWDYALNGDDWNCICQCGKYQSPIDITTDTNKKFENKEDKFTLKKFFENIFFDFIDPDFDCRTEDEDSTCPHPIVKNTGYGLEIEYDCGVMVMPPHMNGYKCKKLVLHSPGEHKIDSKSFELELQIHFVLTDKRIVDFNTRETIILVVLFKGIDKDNIPKYASGEVKSHPFLDQFEIDKFPRKKGEARLLNRPLNFKLIFDSSMQPYQIKAGSQKYKRGNFETDTEIQFLEASSTVQTSSKVQMAINDITFDKNHPIKEFYIYNGSYTQPPCEETVQYIVVPQPVYAPMNQIIVNIII